MSRRPRRHTATLAAALAGGLIASLAVTVAPAQAATPPDPENGQVQQQTPTFSFSWDRVLEATGYTIQVDDDPGFGSPELTTTTVNTTVVADKVLKAGTNHWRVRTTSAGGNSGWSTYSFDAEPLDKPVNSSPADETVLQQPHDPPLLQWAPVEGATKYNVYLDTATEFPNPKKYTTPTTSFAVPDTLGAGKWHWKVTAELGSLLSQDSNHTSFTISPLPAPELISPSPGDTRPLTDVVLDWSTVPGAKSYELQISTSRNFTSTDILHTQNNVKSTRYSPPNGLDNDEYYWRVRAIDANGNSSPWQASTDLFERSWKQPADHRPWPVFPRQDGFTTTPDSVNHNPDALPVKTITTAAPFLQWTPVKHATYYQLQVADNAAFSGSSVQTCRVAGTTYTPGNFPVNARMQTGNPRADERCRVHQDNIQYWRVRPMDQPFSNAGIQGIYSPTQKFRWDPDYFSEDTLHTVRPVHNTTVTGTPTFSWKAARSIDRYKVEILDADSRRVASVTTHATSWTPPAKLDPAKGPFTWSLTAVNADDSESVRTERRFFYAPADIPPATNALAATSGNDASDPTSGTIRAPRLAWVPHAEAARYVVDIRRKGTAAWQSPSGNELWGRSINYPSLTDPGIWALTPGEYEWRLSAYTEEDVLLTPRSIYSFRILDFPVLTGSQVTGKRLALEGTTLEAGGGCANTSSPCENVPTTPVFAWDPVEDASYYVLYVSYDENFTNLTEPVTKLPSTYLTSYAYTFGNDVPTLADNTSGVPYYWYVRPCKTAEVCGLDPISSATTLSENSFRKLSPSVEDATIIGADTTTTHPTVRTGEVTFSWRDYLETNQDVTWQSGDLPDASHQSAKQYRVRVRTTTSPQTMLDNILVDQTTYTAFGKMYPEGDLEWQVAAIDSHGNELTPTPWQRFTKESPKPTLLQPAKNGRGSGSVAFRWEPQDFASEYVVEVARNGDTTFSNANRVFSKSGVKPTAYTYEKPLPLADSDYVWRVRTRDAHSNLGPWSDPQAFRVVADDLELTAPAVDAPTEPNGAVLQWKPLPEAATYFVTITREGSTSTVESVTTPATAFAPTKNLQAGRHTWTVTARDTDGKALAAASRTFVVDASISTVAEPVIAVPVDGALAGLELGLELPVWNRDGVTVTYQWLRDGTADRKEIGPTYTIKDTDRTKKISVAVTGSRPGYQNTTVTSEPVTIQTSSVLNPSTPVIEYDTESPQVGSLLNVEPLDWNMEGVVETYRWLRDGKAIARQTDSTYVAAVSDFGKEITVEVKGTLAPYGFETVTSEPVTIGAGDEVVASQPPAISGARAVGSTLSATAGTWPRSTKFSYQWLRNGKPIAGATSSRYRLVLPDANTRLSVTVTGTLSGYAPGTATSVTVKVPKAASSSTVSLSRTKVARGTQVRLTGRVSVSGVAATTGTLVIKRGKKNFRTVKLKAKHKGSRTIKLPKKMKKGKYRFRVVFKATKKIKKSRSSVVVLQIT